MFAVFVYRVDSETINTLFQPESDGAVVYSLASSFVVPVQVGLLLSVEM